MDIEKELDELEGLEGGYSNDPSDSGGETNHGVTVFVARAFGFKGRMIDMTKAEAREIFKARFWIQPRFVDVMAVSPDVSKELFDTGVNMGTSTASKFLQRCLNVLNNGGTLYPDIDVDGNIGQMTLHCLISFIHYRGLEGEKTLLRMLNALQSVRYIEIAEARPKDEKFEFGWQTKRAGG